MFNIKKIKLFTKEQIKNNPEIKKAIDYGWKNGYDVNTHYILEPKDFVALYNRSDNMNCEICGDELTEEEEEAGVCSDCSCVILHDAFEEEQLFGDNT